MKIYFAGSIRGGREDVEVYEEIIKHLQTHGEVLTEHIGDKKLDQLGEKDDNYIYERDLSWVMSADCTVAEVTTPSLGVGFEIGRATAVNKKVLCLYKVQENKKLSAMIAGCPDVTVKKYNSLDEAKKIIDEFFKVIS